ncbi:aminopeptidase N-like isoform X2 [Homalodisca vitripennis]|uniref:aminopeptidase N-like isoform X2 n=1 Tax=Homalodisca vitripennis TaxID=197043 RepID=UPI001EEB311E|nr:aminopeptidase N-like isoform X2 [Homalodisca vitripennis]
MQKFASFFVTRQVLLFVLLLSSICLLILSLTGMLQSGVLALLVFVGFTSAENAPYEPPSYRLKGDVVPSHYILEIVTDLDNFSYTGNVHIEMECKLPTDTIYLHSVNLNIHEKEVTFKRIIKEQQFEDLPLSGIDHDIKNEFLVIKLKEKLNPGTKYTLYIPFDGILSEGLAGYYRSSYLDRSTNTTKWLAVTQFESTDARRAFPCFDEPSMKAIFTIKMGHKQEFTSVSNMPLVQTIPFENKPGWVWDQFKDTVPMSTYLVAFMVSDFEFRESDHQSNNVVFRIWARKDAIGQVEFARTVGPKFLSYYEQYFDVGYPLPKQDMVAIPDFSAGAMENWGLITYRETALLYDERTTSRAFQHNIASVIAHELAHQWFGNLVTMFWWTDLWLNEGFATYVAGLGVHHEFPEWNSLDGVAVENLLTVYSLDALESSHPVSVPIGHPSEITQIFDHISYKKGAFLLRMMNLFLGEEVFRHGVSEYLKKHRYGNAAQDDLWASLTEQAHKANTLSAELSVKLIMDSWTVQTGYPVLSVVRDYQNGKATVSQHRFLAVKSKDEENKLNTCWWIPLTFSTPKLSNFSETRPKQWLSCNEKELSIDIQASSTEWVVFNNKFAGLYRVNYDKDNWNLLADVLNSPDYTKIDVLNRVQILSDALDLAWRGDLPYPLAFRLVSYLKHETEYLPWRAALNTLNNIDRMMRRTPKYGQFREYMRELLQPIYNKFSKMTQQPDTYEGIKHQSLILSWSCRFDIGDCVSQAKDLFRQWQLSPETNMIPKDLRSLVYCQGVKAGGEKAWEFIWQKYRASNVGTEQSQMLGALSCSREVWLINRYLEWSIDESSGIRRQDSSTVFGSVAHTDMGYYLAQRFFTRNIQRIYKYHGPKATRLGRYIASLAEQMIYNDELVELKRVTDENGDVLNDSKLAISQSLESVAVNIAWLQNNYETISKTLSL